MPFTALFRLHDAKAGWPRSKVTFGAIPGVPDTPCSPIQTARPASERLRARAHRGRGIGTLVVLSAIVELALQALLLVPRQAVAEQTDTARLLLARQAHSVANALDADQPSLTEPAMELESDRPDVRRTARVDPQGDVALAATPSWPDRTARQSFKDLPERIRSETTPGSPRTRADLHAPTLSSATPIPFPARQGPQPEPPSDRTGGPQSAPLGSSALGALYFALDLRRSRARSRTRRLSPRGWLPWALLTTIATTLFGRISNRRNQQSLSPRQALELTEDGPRPGGDGQGPHHGPGDGQVRPAGSSDAGHAVKELQKGRDGDTLRCAYAAEMAAEGIWDWDLTTNRVFYSQRCRALLGLDPRETPEGVETWLDRISPPDLVRWRTAMERHLSGAVPEFVCEHLLLVNRRPRHVIARGRIVERDEGGRPLRVIGTLADIAERKLAQQSLAYLVNLETALLEASRALSAAKPEAVDATVQRALGAVAQRMNVEHACVFALRSRDGQLRTTHAWSLVEDAPHLADWSPLSEEQLPRWIETLRHGKDVLVGDRSQLPEAWGHEQELLTKIGIHSVTAVPVRDGGRLGGFVALMMDSGAREWGQSELRTLRLFADLVGSAFERRRLELELLESRQRVEDVARYDRLTRLPNRHLLGDRMQEAMAAAMEGGTQLAVCYLDLDNFKAINDQHGQPVGDQVLIATAARLREHLRESDTVARLGGDEFVLLMGEFDSLLECANSMDRLVKGLAQPYLVDGLELRVTASIGAILYPRDPHDADTLLRHAHQAMYEAKQRGRNRLRFFDTIRNRRAHARRSQLGRLGEAIQAGELRLFYQPKVDMREGKVVGAEGLVRWRHPTKGLLPPGAFIPLLDGTELQQRLDWWVIRTGLEQLTAWHAQGLDLRLSLNISARSVQHAGFVSELHSGLQQHLDLAPNVLSLEVLESEALGDLDAVANVMERCDDLGVRFALDDFGTGYSSLTYFRRLPAQVLKIDQTFVRDMLRSRDDRNIVKGVVGLARAFQREVIAEGVESAAHGLMLLHMGCEQAQGYGVCEPMPADRVPRWISRYVPPSLWKLNSSFDWSAGAILDLLTMESVHRDWITQLLRAVSNRSVTRAPELAERRCPFGRWYYGEGYERFGDLGTFRALEEHHVRVHERARQLLRNQGQGQLAPEQIRSLIEARDQFLAGLHRVQEQVLGALD